MRVYRTQIEQDWVPKVSNITTMEASYDVEIALKRPVFETKPDIDNHTLQSFIQEETKPEAIVTSVEGTVLGIYEEKVRVAIKESIIHFPRILFKDSSLIGFGQPVYYLIKQKSNGVRYQEFGKREIDQPMDTERDELLEMLYDI